MSDKPVETSVEILQSMLNLFGKAVTSPRKVVGHTLNFGQEVIKSVTGESELKPEKGDKRFRDPAWASNPLYRVVLQAYLAWRKELESFVADLDLPERDRLRANLLISIVSDTVAPTNTLLGNPTALKTTLDHGGKNLVSGVKHMIHDLRHNNGLPSMVDKSKFEVGKNLAVSKGKVVYKEPHLELLQYEPQTAEVFKRPVFIVPPQINKFYAWDLAPGRSVVEFLVNQGHQVFVVSWRNPTKEQAEWGLNSYVEALDRASKVACDITAADDLNILGACSGGITAALLLGYWAATGVTRANSLTLLVAILDTEGGKNTTMGLFANIETLELARLFSGSKGVLEGKDLERAFAWLRPNDLIWAYWVNNYLLGNEPPAFDILFWNADTTNLPARLHGDLISLLESGGITGSKGWHIDGLKIDLEKVTCDAFVVGGTTDHITPWQGCYMTLAMLGGKTEFLLSQAGHVQALINPPGNPKAQYFTNPGAHGTPEEFMQGASAHSGSWWPYWMHWLIAHGGDKVAAPSMLGSNAYPPLGDVPGEYVRVKA